MKRSIVTVLFFISFIIGNSQSKNGINDFCNSKSDTVYFINFHYTLVSEKGVWATFHNLDDLKAVLANNTWQPFVRYLIADNRYTSVIALDHYVQDHCNTYAKMHFVGKSKLARRYLMILDDPHKFVTIKVIKAFSSYVIFPVNAKAVTWYTDLDFDSSQVIGKTGIQPFGTTPMLKLNKAELKKLEELLMPKTPKLKKRPKGYTLWKR